MSDSVIPIPIYKQLKNFRIVNDTDSQNNSVFVTAAAFKNTTVSNLLRTYQLPSMEMSSGVKWIEQAVDVFKLVGFGETVVQEFNDQFSIFNHLVDYLRDDQMATVSLAYQLPDNEWHMVVLDVLKTVSSLNYLLTDYRLPVCDQRRFSVQFPESNKYFIFILRAFPYFEDLRDTSRFICNNAHTHALIDLICCIHYIRKVALDPFHVISGHKSDEARYLQSTKMNFDISAVTGERLSNEDFYEINDVNGITNCVYVTAAAFKRMTVSNLFHNYQIPQKEMFLEVNGIEQVVNVFEGVGLGTIVVEQFDDQFSLMKRLEDRLGDDRMARMVLAFEWSVKRWHVVVLKIWRNNALSCLNYLITDFQQPVMPHRFSATLPDAKKYITLTSKTYPNMFDGAHYDHKI